VKQDPKTHILASKIGSFQLERGTIYGHKWGKKRQNRPWVYLLEHHTSKYLNPFNFKTTWDSFKEDFSF
jgi:hypothetical protein